MSVWFTCSPTAAVRRQCAIEFLRARGPLAATRVLAPTSAAAQALIAEAFPNGAFGPLALAESEWVAREAALAEGAAPALRRATPHQLQAAVGAALSALPSATQRTLGPMRCCARTERALLAALGDLPAALGHLPAALGDLPAALGREESAAPLAQLQAKFIEVLQGAGLGVGAMLASRAARGLTAAPKPAACAGLVLLDLGELSADVHALLAYAARAADAALITFLELDAGAAQLARELDAQPYKALVPTAESALALRLFAPLATTPAPSAGVRIFDYPSVTHECLGLLRQVQAHAAGGMAYERMAVLLRHPEQYLPALQESARRAQVPLHCATFVPHVWRQGSALVALLAMAEEDCSVARFCEYLAADVLTAASAGAAAGAVPPSASEYGIRMWEFILQDARVIASPARWAARLSLWAASAQARAAKLLVDAPASGYASPAEALAGVQCLQLGSACILQALSRIPDTASGADWLAVLIKLAELAVADSDELKAALREILLLRSACMLQRSDALRLLRGCIATRHQTGQAAESGALFVGTAAALRGREWDVVFVPGLAEGLFPVRTREGPLPGDDAGAAAARATRERVTLQLAVGAATREFVASYPRADVATGKSRSPSIYLEELQTAWLGAAAPATSAPLALRCAVAAQSALDVAEYDLAVLQQLLARPEAECVGHARYLLRGNPHLARSLRARAHRWHVKRMTFADGLAELSPAGALALAKHQVSARSFSPTALQNMAACPYRFFLQAVLRLRPTIRAERMDELDPLRRGSLVHDVQFRLLRELREQGKLPLASGARAELESRIDALVAERAALVESELWPENMQLWNATLNQVRADVRGWLDSLLAEPEWQPKYFELAFGLDDDSERDASSHDAPLALDIGLRLRGSIDLVEQNARGELRATDYKTGRVRAKAGAVIAGGEVLQPALYALALESMYPAVTVRESRLFYSSHAGGYEVVAFAVDDGMRAAARVLVSSVQELLAAGMLPAMPLAKACDYCDYRRVCGPYEVLRTARKKSDALAPLLTLRGQR